MSILKRLSSRKKRDPIDDYVTPERIEKLLRNGKSGPRAPEVRHFQFALILLNDSAPDEILATIGRLVDTLFQHRAVITSVDSSLIVAIWGSPFPADDLPELRLTLVGALLRENGNQLRIAHGQCSAPVGMLGGKNRFSYGPVIPGFSAILKSLLDAKPGTALEIS